MNITYQEIIEGKAVNRLIDDIKIWISENAIESFRHKDLKAVYQDWGDYSGKTLSAALLKMVEDGDLKHQDRKPYFVNEKETQEEESV